MDNTVMEEVRINRQGEQSLVGGHLWVFSNEVVSRPSAVADGEPVRVLGEKGNFLGVGYVNTHSLIMVRLLSRKEENLDEEFFERRIAEALGRRAGRFGGSYRAVYGESDFLPGLIVDVYEGTAVIQIVTAGMEMQKALIVDAVDKLLSPPTIVVRNDSPTRQEEGLSLYTETAKGSVGDVIEIREGDLRFLVDVMKGHKTGFYLDQRENRAEVRGVARDRVFLDAFCYTGAFGVHALHSGARGATFVDASERALDIARENVRINGLQNAVFTKGDVFDFLKATSLTFDVVIVDPPSFIKSRKKIKEGEKGYIDLHRKALRRVRDSGLLMTFSCSHHMRRQRFREVARIAAYGHCDLYLLRDLTQPADHPVLLNIPETEYLKGMLLQVRRR